MDAQLGSMHFACAIITFIKFLHLNSAHLLLMDSIEYGTGSSWSYVALSLEPASRSSALPARQIQTSSLYMYAMSRSNMNSYRPAGTGTYMYVMLHSIFFVLSSKNFLRLLICCADRRGRLVLFSTGQARGLKLTPAQSSMRENRHQAQNRRTQTKQFGPKHCFNILVIAKE